MNAPIRLIADLDPSTLSAPQRRALRIVKKQHCYRRYGGFGRPPHGISLDVAATMLRLGLCRQDYSGRQPELVLTGVGENVLAVMEQRALRRTAA